MELTGFRHFRLARSPRRITEFECLLPFFPAFLTLVSYGKPFNLQADQAKGGHRCLG
jgi:hypothetical protein